MQNGEIAVATLRTPSALDDLTVKYPKSQLLVLKCDVTILSDIVDAFAQTQKVFGRCDVVFNNAAFVAMGEIEGTPDEIARQIIEVDFWGATNISKEAVKFFRDINPAGKGGRLLNMSSMAGTIAVPAFGFYSAA